jgi:serine/threonine protein kinase
MGELERVVKTGDVVDGRYRIIKTLGSGATGTVFLAEHMTIKRHVALKVLSSAVASDKENIERFIGEARAAGTLGNVNIVESTDIGYTGASPFIVFEYLEGTLLTDEVYRVGGLPVRRVLRIATQIASALNAAHDAGILHRGLESDSVFLTDKDDTIDHVKVLDFGCSRLRSTAARPPDFLAPEQITAPLAVDSRADIYALGVIMYEMLTARRPFSSDEDPRAMMRRIVKETPPPLQRGDVPAGLVELIFDRMLAKDPTARLRTMGEVEAALAQLATEGSGVNRRTPSTQPGNDVSRNSDVIPRPAGVLDTQPMATITLPQPPAAR